MKPKLRKIYLMIRKPIIANLVKISPVIATKVLYRMAFKRKINLKKPITFNEKLQWLKLYWQNPLVAKCADKYDMREYVIECGCSNALNEVYGMYTNVNDIDFDKFPNQFAIKGTHGCGYNIICTDKKLLDKDNTKIQLNKWLKERYSLVAAEIQYDKMLPKIICEKYIRGKNSEVPNDYKVYCFNGKPLFTMACVDRIDGKASYYFFDNNWCLLPYNDASKNCKVIIEKPNSFSEMIEYCEKLTKPFPFVRMDFYDTDRGAILGEMTFTPAGALDSALSYDIDKLMGDLINLPSKY